MGALVVYYDTPVKVKSIKLLQAFIPQPYTWSCANHSRDRGIISNLDNFTNKQQPVVSRIDMFMKLALLVGVILVLILFWLYPNLIRLGLYAEGIVCLGLFCFAKRVGTYVNVGLKNQNKPNRKLGACQT
jgi:hypothetical protein